MCDVKCFLIRLVRREGWSGRWPKGVDSSLVLTVSLLSLELVVTYFFEPSASYEVLDASSCDYTAGHI